MTHLSNNLSTLIRDFIYHLTANFFDRGPAHPNPLVHSIGNYSLVEFHHQYKKYTGCNRRKGPDFGRVFLMLNYTENPQNTYIQS